MKSYRFVAVLMAALLFVHAETSIVRAQSNLSPGQTSALAKRLLSSRLDPVPLRCRFTPNGNGTLSADCSMDRLGPKRWLDDHDALADKAFKFTGATTTLYSASNLATADTATMALRSVTSNERLIARAAPQLLKIAKAPASRAAMLGAIAVGTSVWIYESYKSYMTPNEPANVRVVGVVPAP